MNESASKFMWRQTNIFGEDKIQLTKNDENWIIELNIEHLYVLIYIYKASEMKIGILKKESLKFLTVRTRYSQKSRGYKTEGGCNFSSDLLIKVNREIIMTSSMSPKNLSTSINGP